MFHTTEHSHLQLTSNSNSRVTYIKFRFSAAILAAILEIYAIVVLYYYNTSIITRICQPQTLVYK